MLMVLLFISFKTFMAASNQKEDSARIVELKNAVNALPEINRIVLAYLIQVHLSFSFSFSFSFSLSLISLAHGIDTRLTYVQCSIELFYFYFYFYFYSIAIDFVVGVMRFSFQ